MAIDVSWVSEGMPLYALVFVVVLSFAVISKTKIIGESKGINFLISLILGVIFISFASVRQYVVNVTVWFAVILTFIFFFMLITAFIIKEPAAFFKPIAIVFIILMALIIIITVFASFPGTHAYIPGSSEEGGNEFLLNIKHFILKDSFLSGVLLIIILIAVAFIITR